MRFRNTTQVLSARDQMSEKTGKSMLFLEVSEAWPGSRRPVRSIILEAETNLTLTSLLERENDRGGEL